MRPLLITKRNDSSYEQVNRGLAKNSWPMAATFCDGIQFVIPTFKARRMSTNGVAVEESEFGKGVFAIRNLAAGEKILVLTGKPVPFSETVLMGDEESFCVQIGMDHYIIPDHPFYLINHSCDPNTGVNETMELITLRPVGKGEEIFWDYSTSMLERHWTMECECRTSLCRGVVKDFDRLPGDLQKKYLQIGIVFPFIREWVLQIAK